ncbi:replicative DNA helicase [Thermoactinospora rubra]|uniref:replicative DNA helicase n=1 Tax=Thermoactinospora rubra TaxID=1088767 RepID=UPI000A100615|nr:replicative DNA helicase [Thermoactinospora rubra]
MSLGLVDDEPTGPAFERTPPHNIEAEQSVLGGMLLSKDAIADVVELIRADDFYRPAHQIIYEVITDLYGRGEPADAVTVFDELQKRGEMARVGGAAYLHTLTAVVPTAANAGYYAKIVREQAVLRRLIEAGTRIVSYGYGGNGEEVDDLVDRAQAEIYKVTERRTSEDYAPLSEIMPHALDELEAIGNRGGQMVGVPTGFQDLDQLTNGLHPGQMIVVAARPAIGKALALDTPLPTPDGWTTMGEVRVGDELLDGDGKPTRVVAATEVMTGRPCYEVEFDDGAVIVADGSHQWQTDAGVLTTEEIARTLSAVLTRVRPAVPAVPALGLEEREILAVRPVATVPVRCVEVDNPDHLYLAGPTRIPTHNSTLGLDFARSAAIKHGMTTVIFSLEMSRNEITMRLLSAEARVALHAMRSGMMSDDDWTRLARRMSEVAEAPLFIDDSPNMSMMEIRAKCRRLKQRHDLRFVIIDYLQLMSSPKKVESRQNEVSEISRAIKLLAKELEVPVVAISQLNRGPEQRTDKRPQVSDLRESGCLTAGTRILRADTGAEVTLGELLESGARDVPVWSLDDRLKLVPRTMTHVFPSGVKPVYRVRLRSGREVEATGNHPFLTYDGWRAVADLTPGTRVAVPRHVPPPLTIVPWDDDEVLLLAHMIGDGSMVRRQPIRYASTDEANLQAVGQAAARRFGITAVRDDHEAARCTSLRLPAPFRLTHGRRNPIAEWLDGLGLFGRRSHEKFVPAGVFSLPKTQAALFLRHLWATDGCVWWDDKVGQARIYYSSTSRRLVDDVARLLLRFNVMTRIREIRKGNHRPCYHLYIYGAENQLRFLDEIGVYGERGKAAEACAAHLRGITGNTNLDTVPKQVWDRVREVLAERGMSQREFAAAMQTQYCGSALWKRAPSRERVGRVAQVLEASDLDLLATNDVFWDELASIELLGEQPVFDATVLGTHNFVANGIAVHNSIEQDADVVILLHREDAYERESPRAGEADLIVAKHRNGPTATVTVAFQGHYSRFVDMAQH